MTDLIKLTQKQHEFIQTFSYNNYTSGESINKEKAIFYISRWGWSFTLKDGNGVEYSTGGITEGTEIAPFKQDERFKIIDAIINGYEVIKPRYRLFAQPYNEVTNEVEKMYFFGSGISPRTTPIDKELKQDWNKTFSLEEAKKIKSDFERLELILYLEEV